MDNTGIIITVVNIIGRSSGSHAAVPFHPSGVEFFR
jgi:hypothetical protein